MPLNPSPTIETGLGLVTQGLLRTDQTRMAILTFALNVSGLPSPSLAQTAVNDFAVAFNAHITPFIDSQCFIQLPTIRLGDGTSTPFEAVSTGAPSPGGSTLTALPPAVALLVKKSTPLGGKKNRGRTYIPYCLDVTKVNEVGAIDSSQLAAYVTNCAAFLSALNASTIPMCIAHKQFNVPLPPHFVTNIATGALVTSFIPESTVATQRRRQRS